VIDRSLRIAAYRGSGHSDTVAEQLVEAIMASQSGKRGAHAEGEALAPQILERHPLGRNQMMHDRAGSETYRAALGGALTARELAFRECGSSWGGYAVGVFLSLFVGAGTEMPVWAMHETDGGKKAMIGSRQPTSSPDESI
jgi:hypothetical protein